MRRRLRTFPSLHQNESNVAPVDQFAGIWEPESKQTGKGKKHYNVRRNLCNLVSKLSQTQRGRVILAFPPTGSAAGRRRFRNEFWSCSELLRQNRRVTGVPVLKFGLGRSNGHHQPRTGLPRNVRRSPGQFRRHPTIPGEIAASMAPPIIVKEEPVITELRGKLIQLSDDAAIIEIDAFRYQVLIPDFSRRAIQLKLGTTIPLFIIHYIDGNPTKGGRMTPRLIGFVTEIERDFFDLFCSVDGVGVKKALRGMVRPVQDIAVAIEEQDVKVISSLPGIGPAMAERIIAKLRRKMARFALLVARDSDSESAPTDTAGSVVEETYQILLTLGHNEADARQLIDQALLAKSKYKDVEAMLQAVYDKSR